MRDRTRIAGVGLAVLVLSLACASCKEKNVSRQSTEGAGAATSAPPAAAPAEPTGAGGPVEELVIWAEGEPDMGPAPLTVKFNVDLIDAATSPTYVWDFGDGSPESQEPNPTRTYQRPGKYTVRVRIKDASGNVGTDEVVIDVEAPE